MDFGFGNQIISSEIDEELTHSYTFVVLEKNVLKIKTMFTIDPILSFLNFNELYAVVGVSHDKKKFGRMVYEELKKKGYKVFAVNPNVSSVEGDKVYATLADLPKEVKRVIVLTPKSKSAEIIQQAFDTEMTHIWLQQMCDSPKALGLGKSGMAQFIYGKCIFMVAEPVVGMHKLHRSMKRMLGRFPKTNN
jgi:hypothetical protein